MKHKVRVSDEPRAVVMGRADTVSSSRVISDERRAVTMMSILLMVSFLGFALGALLMTAGTETGVVENYYLRAQARGIARTGLNLGLIAWQEGNVELERIYLVDPEQGTVLADMDRNMGYTGNNRSAVAFRLWDTSDNGLPDLVQATARIGYGRWDNSLDYGLEWHGTRVVSTVIADIPVWAGAAPEGEFAEPVNLSSIREPRLDTDEVMMYSHINFWDENRLIWLGLGNNAPDPDQGGELHWYPVVGGLPDFTVSTPCSMEVDISGSWTARKIFPAPDDSRLFVYAADNADQKKLLQYQLPGGGFVPEPAQIEYEAGKDISLSASVVSAVFSRARSVAANGEEGFEAWLALSDGTVYRLDQEGEILNNWNLGGGDIAGMALDPIWPRLYLADSAPDGGVFVYSMTALLDNADISEAFVGQLQPPEAPFGVDDVSITPDGELIMALQSSGAGGSPGLWAFREAKRASRVTITVKDGLNLTTDVVLSTVVR